MITGRGRSTTSNFLLVGLPPVKGVLDEAKAYTTAGQRATAAIGANPEKPNRAIAAELGIGHQTVMRAREATGPYGPAERTVGLTAGSGRSGKSASPAQVNINRC